MRWIDEARFRLDALFRSARIEEELDEEMRAHLEQLADDFKAEGLSETEARRRARREFGSFDRAREDCRESWGVRMVADFWSDVKFGARELRASKGFAIVSTATLGLAIGACVTIFSALDAALLQPLPYPKSDRMVALAETSAQWGDTSVSGGAFHDWRDNSQSLEAIMLFAPALYNLRRDDGAVRLTGKEVTSGFFEVLGIDPLRGRGFRPEDEMAGGENHVVILAEDSWRGRFGGDEALIGQTILLNDAPHEVIGILPAGAWIDRRDEFFVPAVLHPHQPWRSGRSAHWARAWGRLKPGVSAEELALELRGIKASRNSEYPEFKKDWSVAAYPLQETLARELRPILLILGAAVAAVLLIACANVANLLLARGAYRRREMSARLALGASSQRIARQVLTESLLLSALGGAAGILLALGGIRLLRLLASDLLPGVIVPQLDLRALALAVATACGAGILFGCLPAWSSSRRGIGEVLKEGGKGSSGRARSQSLLVVAEVALTVTLLACAALLLRSLAKATGEYPGFNADRALTFDLTLPDEQYGGPEKRLAYLDAILESLSSAPGAIAVGSCSESPLTDQGQTNFVSRHDRPGTESDRLAGAVYSSGAYFEAMGARLLKGRFLQKSDDSQEAARAIVIDETLARALFGDEDPIGKLLNTSGFTWEIVGVIADMKLRPQSPSHGYAFMPQAYFPFSISLVVRIAGPPGMAMASIRERLASIDSGVPPANLRTLDEAFRGLFAQRRLVLGLIGSFAAAAILLASIGLYGVLSYTVAARERELGIRRSLGATPRDVIALVMKDGGRLIAIGLTVGMAGVLVAARLLANQLYQVSSYDPVAIGLTFIALGTVSLFAMWLPARRAIRFDPNTSLKRE